MRSLLQAGIRSVALVTADSETFISFRGYLIETLQKVGIKVAYVGPVVDVATREWLAARNIEISEIPMARNAISPRSDLRMLFDLRRTLRSLAPDAVITMRIKPTVYGLLAAAAAGVHHRFVLVTGLGYAFTEQRGQWRWWITNRIVRSLYRLSMRYATAVAFQNPDDERDFRQWRILGAKVPSTVVGGSGVDVEHYAMTSLPNRAGCLFAGRLLKDKGIAEFIGAARIVRAALPAAEFLVLGPAETNPAAFPIGDVQAAVREGHISYHGEVKDVRPYIAACQIFVLPSYYREGTPRSTLEAMSMGRAVVTTDVPGCRETVDHGVNGLLIPPRDVRKLADAILELLRDPQRAANMGERGRRLVEQRFEVGKVTGAMLAFYGDAALSRQTTRAGVSPVGGSGSG